ncbi:hypothetical protein EKO04_002065 [Ascochyta lentis]|uniref:Carboxylic ester hydrolase n=1 Tax=Ascochyta lentis TaxID=205686 RepID=A0A8H7MKZ5_9PLEO|nr:hypothetical protein EKO04_002065 [Ascochyta lentis]
MSPSILSSVVQVALLFSAFANAAYIPTRNNSSSTTTIKLEKGTLEGVNGAYGQDFFLGIPYAKPPVDNLRFRRPQPADAWDDIRPAQEYGSWCYGVSIGLIGFSQNNTGSMSEDCLTLNVVRPAHTPRKAKLPVAVWIHGGNFLEGSSADQRYNGSFLVQESVDMGTPIIYVSMNYRLGIFGFLAGPALEESGDTNIAIHDQRMALTWIQENIAQFGGDPEHVTIFGESAGAASVGFHLLANGGRESGLFHAAIAQSGGPFSYGPFSNASQRSQDFQKTLQHANCTAAEDALRCLKNVPADILNTFPGLANAYPMIDGTLIQDYSSRQLANGSFSRVPLLMGTNRNEGSTFLKSIRPTGVSTEEDFFSVIRALSAGVPLSNATLKQWSNAYQSEINNASTGGTGTLSANPGPAFGALHGKTSLWLGDYLFTAGRRYANQMWAKHGVATYCYLFDAVPAYLDPETYGSAHFSDVGFAFGNAQGVGYDESPFASSSAEEKAWKQRLAKVMSRMWISFIVHKTPNHHGVPDIAHWPEYSKNNATNIVLGETSDPYTTPDTWRGEALQKFIDFASYYGR